MIEPKNIPSVIINFHDVGDGDVAVVLRTKDKIHEGVVRTPAQQAAYDVLQIFAERSQASGDKVKKFEKSGDMTEYTVGKVK